MVALAAGEQTPPSLLLLDLSGTHRFQRGDDPRWSDPSFDDQQWQEVITPGTWQDQGVAQVCELGWYRIRFEGSVLPRTDNLTFSAGMVGNISELFLNGEPLGMIGSLDPLMSPPSRTIHLYPLPATLIRSPGTNVLAMRVYNQTGAGGVVLGPFGIGDRETLKLANAASLAPREWIIWGFTIIYGTVGILALSLCWRRGVNPRLGAVAAFSLGACLLYAIVLLMFYGRYPGWAVGFSWAVAMAVAALVPIFAFRCLDAPPRFERLTILSAAVFCLVVLVIGDRRDIYAVLTAIGSLLVLGWMTAAFWQAVRGMLRRAPNARVVGIGLTIFMAGPLIDTLTSTIPVYSTSAAVFQMTEISFLLTLPIVAYIGMERFWRDQSRLQELRGRVMKEGEMERRRLARDLHDGVGQSLQAARLSLQLRGGGSEGRGGDDPLVMQLGACIEEIRALSREMHPSMIHGKRLEFAVKERIEELRETRSESFEVSVEGDLDCLTEETTAHAYLMFKEMLGNAVRHAAARSILTVISVRDGRLTLQVSDDGVGIEPSSSPGESPSVGLGLLSIRERCELLKGFHRVSKRPGGGTVVEISLPCGGDVEEPVRNEVGSEPH